MASATEVFDMRLVSLPLALALATSLAPVSVRAGWFSYDTPPANAKPLSTIIKAVEDQGCKAVTDVGFEDGKWSIEALQADGNQVELSADPITGQVSH
jgi:hypothetical protein